MVFSLEFGKFFQNRHKEQILVNSSEHIKKIKQVRGGGRGEGTGVAMEIQNKTKWTIKKLYFRYFLHILSQFHLNGVSMDRCQICWLWKGGSGEVVGYKIEIPLPNSWILKKREVQTNKDCKDNGWGHDWNLKCFGVERSYLLGKRYDIIKTEYWNVD